jgi:hypothetical protein
VPLCKIATIIRRRKGAVIRRAAVQSLRMLQSGASAWVPTSLQLKGVSAMQGGLEEYMSLEEEFRYAECTPEQLIEVHAEAAEITSARGELLSEEQVRSNMHYLFKVLLPVRSRGR